MVLESSYLCIYAYMSVAISFMTPRLIITVLQDNRVWDDEKLLS